MHYTIATRKSRLALIQAKLAVDHLKQQQPHTTFTLLPLVTTGDRQIQWSLEQAGGKGLFIKELETALLDRRADLAVHSAKDLPTELAEGLTLVGCLPRADPRDVLIRRKESSEQPSSIATSSPRRRAQARKCFPQAQWRDIRGNVETRLRKISDGYADATILAAAGLERLGITRYERLAFHPLNPQKMVPAAGQGAIALQCRSEDNTLFTPLLDHTTGHAVTIERRLLSRLQGGCQSASAAYYHTHSLMLFHEAVGFQEYTFPSEEPTTVDSTIDTLLGSLNIQ